MSTNNKKQPPLPESLQLPRSGVDTHAHIDLQHFNHDLPAVLDRAHKAGLAHICTVFLSVDAWRRGQTLFAPYPQVFFQLGIHPTDAGGCTDETLAAMEHAFMTDPRLRALGEIGLDYYWKDCPPETQHRVFREQLRLARRLDAARALPVSIHSRDAFDDTMAILCDEGYSGRPLLWHCFGGSAEQARSILEHGWHISIPGFIGYPANAGLRATVAALPMGSLMLETDCPYISPQEYRGKRNEPAYAAFTARAIAQARGMDTAELWAACGDNARRFFGLAEKAHA